MSPLQLMEISKPKFTPNDYLIYETITKNPTLVVHMTTSVLAEKCGVSQPALSRFIKTLGYRRYQDFRADFITWFSQKSGQASEGSSQLSYFNIMYQLLDEARRFFSVQYMQDIAGYINGFLRVFATGVGKSYHPAELLEILSYKTKRHIYSIHRDTLMGAADYIDETDLLIIFSVSAGAHIMTDAVRTNGKILLVTANPGHGYEGIADRVLVFPYIPPDPEASSVSPILFDMFVEMLIPYLLPSEQPLAQAVRQPCQPGK